MQILPSARSVATLTSLVFLLAIAGSGVAQDSSQTSAVEPGSLEQPEPDPPQILILSSLSQDTQPYAALRDAFMEQLNGRMGGRVSLYQLDLQQRLDNSPESDELRAQLLRNQYSHGPPQLVVAIGPPAIQFWLNFRDVLFPGAHALYAASDQMLQSMDLRPGDYYVANHFTFEVVVDNIMQLLPQTERIMVVFGASQNERDLTQLARERLPKHLPGIEFSFTSDLPFQTLQQRLSELPPQSAVLHGIYDSDADGLVLAGDAGLALVVAASKAPVFGFFEEHLGQGIVGGPLIPLDATAESLAETAVELLQTGRASEPHKVTPLNTPTYDWRELQKWKIEPERLPQGSILRFRPPTLWDSYARLIVIAIALLVLQTSLIVGLLLQSKHRRLAEQASLSLSRRLITAHEDERRRIARELHDDLSQRLARLSIDAGYLAANPTGSEAAEVARDMLPRLVNISKDVHDMSYLLHPTMVDDLGIAAALSSECERARRHSTATITERIGDLPRDVPHETALALFRIAQEALHNATRHASAECIELGLDFDGGVFRLVVRDDGKGFDTSRTPMEHGLGLYGMQERAALVRGTLKVNSAPGEGTRVVAIIPLAGGEQ